MPKGMINVLKNKGETQGESKSSLTRKDIHEVSDYELESRHAKDFYPKTPMIFK